MYATDEDIHALELLADELTQRSVEARARRAAESRELRAVELELSRAVSEGRPLTGRGAAHPR